MKQNTIVVDLDRCIGCKACEVACKMENSVALGVSRNKVHTVGPIGEYPNLQMYFFPFMCQHCVSPSCVPVCPTGATYKRPEDGIVVIDRDLCIGCQCCKNACQYGVQFPNKEMRVMDKCNMCIHLVDAGEKPACVRNCSGRALVFGDINDRTSDASRVIESAGRDNVHAVKDSGEGPSVRYILRHAKWVETAAQHKNS